MYTIIQNVGGYPWNDLVLYTLVLTVLGFLLVQFLFFSELDRESERHFATTSF